VNTTVAEETRDTLASDELRKPGLVLR
jgi:hypothetical protein